MSATCSACGTTYITGRDDEGDPWRSLCACERALRCCRGKHAATHMRVINRKPSYWCSEHGVAKDLSAPKAPKAPKAPAPPPAPPAPPKTKRAPPVRRTEDELPDTRRPETIKMLYEHHTYRVTCACGDTHRFCDRLPIPRFDIPEAVPRMCCPACKGGHPETPYRMVNP